MSEILNNFCELNIANYTPDDVERLSAWSIDAYDQIKSLEAELAELRKDRERLDWIEENKIQVMQKIDRHANAYVMGCDFIGFEIRAYGWCDLIADGKTPREAIDNAMKEVK